MFSDTPPGGATASHSSYNSSYNNQKAPCMIGSALFC